MDLGKMLADRIRVKAGQNTSLGLIEWGKKYIPHYFFRDFCDMHYVLAGEIDDLKASRGQKKLIIVPRGFAKSTIVTLAGVLKAVCEKSETYIMLISDTSDMSEKYLKDIKDELDNNELIRRDYPLACEHGEMWAAGRFETKNGVCVDTRGKGKNCRGAKFKQYRPTLVVLDDPQSNEDVDSPTTRAKDMAWFDRALVPAGDTNTNYFVVGNNIHRESIIGTLSVRPDFKRIKYAAICTWPTRMELWDAWEKIYVGEAIMSQQNSTNDFSVTDFYTTKAGHFYLANKELMSEGATVLWEEKHSLLDLMVKRANMGHPAFEAEYQNNPRDPSKCEFDENWFKDVYYDDLPEEPEQGKISFLYCDPSKGADIKKRDYPALIALHFYPKLRKAFVECKMEKVPVTQVIDNIITWHKIEGFAGIGIEINGFQELMSEELIAKAAEQGINLPIIPVEHYGINKNTRISRLSVWLQRKFFLFRNGCRDTEIVLSQLKDHPFADHDDGSDALEAVLRILNEYTGLSGAVMNTEEIDDGLGDNIFL